MFSVTQVFTKGFIALSAIAVVFSVGSAMAESNLPPCPSDQAISTWTDCFGEWTFRVGDPYAGEFSAGDKYVGEWKGGLVNGFGTYTLANGEKYEGGFKNDKFEGQGTYSYPNGARYEGEFKNGKSDGQGTYIGKNGNNYIGEWKNNLEHGQGTYIYKNGAKYVGEVREGQLDGQGTLTYADGEKYEGEFSDGNFNGEGTQTYPDGEKREGQFRDGKLNGQGTVTYSSGLSLVAEFVEGEYASIPDIRSDGFAQCLGSVRSMIKSDVAENMSEQDTQYVCACAYIETAGRQKPTTDSSNQSGHLTLIQMLDYYFGGNAEKLYEMELFVVQQTIGQCTLQLTQCGIAPGMKPGKIPCPSRR